MPQKVKAQQLSPAFFQSAPTNFTCSTSFADIPNQTTTLRHTVACTYVFFYGCRPGTISNHSTNLRILRNGVDATKMENSFGTANNAAGTITSFTIIDVPANTDVTVKLQGQSSVGSGQILYSTYMVGFMMGGV